MLIFAGFLYFQICQETAARDGLMKMKQVYETNPALGDPMSIQGQLTDNGQRLDKLRSELKKYQVIFRNIFPHTINWKYFSELLISS